MRVFIQDQGVRKKIPLAWKRYFEDEILIARQLLGVKAVFQGRQKDLLQCPAMGSAEGMNVSSPCF